jgi:hypothetical protein
MKINILYRFKIYTHLVVDDQKNIWELEHCYNKRTKPLRKITYYKERDAYRYNNGYLKHSRLVKLMYKSVETYGHEVSECPF